MTGTAARYLLPPQKNAYGKLSELPAPVREGDYKFDGWFTVGGSGVYVDFAAAYEERPFEDVSESAWYYNAVYYCFDNSYFRGVSEDAFAPGNVMTRAMFATVLYRMADEPAVAGEIAFADVESGKWYTDAIIWAADNDIIGGYGNGEFGTDDPITREQIVTIIWRYKLRPETISASLAGLQTPVP